jgi:hypothetical protein
MTNAYRFLFVAVCLGTTAAWADVIVNTQLGLTELQIAPSTGTLEILSPVTAFTFAQALDSLGGSDAQSNSVQDSATSANAATTLASASGAASATALTGNVTANVNLPANFDGFANSAGQSSLSGMFEINSATTNPINVTFNAFLSVSQFLQTTGAGESATSETIFTLLLPDFGQNPVLGFDNPLAIGPDDVMSYDTSPTLTTSMSLKPNTSYSFHAELDAESNGVSVVPEPSPVWLLFTAFGLATALGQLTRTPRPDRRG